MAGCSKSNDTTILHSNDPCATGAAQNRLVIYSWVGRLRFSLYDTLALTLQTHNQNFILSERYEQYQIIALVSTAHHRLSISAICSISDCISDDTNFLGQQEFSLIHLDSGAIGVTLSEKKCEDSPTHVIYWKNYVVAKLGMKPVINEAALPTGPGLPASEIELALKPFVRLEASNETGSGLGLSIVSRACLLLGCQLKLEEIKGGKGLRAAVSFS